jgi:hypothetical protein
VSKRSPLEGQALSREEIQRVASGGQSDAEIAAAKAEAERERRRKAAAQEEFLRKSQIEGSPEYYFARYKQTLGLLLDDSNASVDFSVRSKEEVKAQVARLKQMQNELKFLKKQINQQIKEKQVEVTQIPQRR